MTRNTKRALAVVMSLALAASGLAVNGSDSSAAAKVKLSATKATIKVGSKKTVTIKGVKASNVKKLTLSSSKKAVATVKKNSNVKFTVTAKKAGKATITAKVALKKAVAKKKAYTLKFKATVKSDSAPIVTEKTVTAFSELEAALTEMNKTGGTVTLDTEEVATFVIAAADYSNVDLIVNAPNADIENNATFKSVTIKAIKASTWREKAKGNNFTISNTTSIRFVAEAGSEIASLLVNSTGGAANAAIEVHGKIVDAVFSNGAPATVEVAQGGEMNSAKINTGSNVSFTGDSTSKIAIQKEEGANVTVAPTLTGATVTEEKPVSPTATAAATTTPVASTAPKTSSTPSGGGSIGGSSTEISELNPGIILGGGTFAVGSTATLTLTGTSAGSSGATLSYQWYVSDDDIASSDDLLFEGATSASVTLSDLAAGTTFYWVEVTAKKNGTVLVKNSDVTMVAVSSSVLSAPVKGTDFKVVTGDSTGEVKLINVGSAVLQYQFRPAGSLITSLDDLTDLSASGEVNVSKLYGGSTAIQAGDLLYVRKKPATDGYAEMATVTLTDADIATGSSLSVLKSAAETAIGDATSACTTLSKIKSIDNWDAWVSAYGASDSAGARAKVIAYTNAGGTANKLDGWNAYQSAITTATGIGQKTIKELGGGTAEANESDNTSEDNAKAALLATITGKTLDGSTLSANTFNAADWSEATWSSAYDGSKHGEYSITPTITAPDGYEFASGVTGGKTCTFTVNETV